MASILRRCGAAFVVLLLGAARLQAQEATVTGTVVDASGAVLPGVSVTATNSANGREFFDVTTAEGRYRLVGVPAGQYKLQAALQGFATMLMENVELLVGQNATIPLTLRIATLAENITVTAATPLVDTRQAQVTGNLDRRQMEELPIPGRNWLEMSTMVKGVVKNNISGGWGNEGPTRAAQGFRINLDGQEITQESVPGYGQPGVSQDAIAEYQVITNMFDITMGRSTSAQVQAVSRAGTNNFRGGAYGYFRSDKLNLADHFTDEVLPFSNQQVGGTLGGPIVRDKTQFFGMYEHTREPGSTVIAPTVYNGQSITEPTGEYQDYILGRVDHQLTSKDHLLVRYSQYSWRHPAEFSTTAYSRHQTRTRDSNLLASSWSRVINSSLLSEVKVNYFHFNFLHTPLEGAPLTPEYNFPGFSVGPPWNFPEDWNQDNITTRWDLTWNKGSHDFKIGTEARVGKDTGWWEARARGQMFFSRLPDRIPERFPLDAWNDSSRWDLTGLDASALRYVVHFAELGGQNDGKGDYSFDIPRPMFGVWIGDSWKMHDRFTLNLGLRYDVAWKDFISPGLKETELVFDTGYSIEDIGYRNNIRDLDDVAPRAGFVWNVGGDANLIIRGGVGLYYSTQGGNQVIDQQLFNGQRVLSNTFENDGLPGFVLDPTRGLKVEDIKAGKVKLPPQSIQVIAHDYQNPWKVQTMIGFQKQINEIMAFDADLVHYKGGNEDVQRDPNVFYNPATGFPFPVNQAGRPAVAPDGSTFGQINLKDSTGRSEYMGLASSFTRRYRNNFQLSVSYTHLFFQNNTGIGIVGYSNQQFNPFNLDQSWGRSQEFQRSTLNMNGVFTLPKRLNLSTAYHFGSGDYTSVTLPYDALGLGGARRIRRDGSLIAPNTFKNDAWSRLDVRASKDFSLGGSVKLTGIAEVFNLLNESRFNRNTIEGLSNFGEKRSSAITPLSGQLAVRLAF
ncbi:MAG: hypothetical protein A3H97_21300 [Acidobacteria bacterium RIFCSPLOWO2_02_FULL_65_29]|nr:MAG: hypothetical protein A3H97_21300 [Acidobacteria bacterium RIFCSPLOWO2_02_FULL_65_29]